MWDRSFQWVQISLGCAENFLKSFLSLVYNKKWLLSKVSHINPANAYNREILSKRNLRKINIVLLSFISLFFFLFLFLFNFYIEFYYFLNLSMTLVPINV